MALLPENGRGTKNNTIVWGTRLLASAARVQQRQAAAGYPSTISGQTSTLEVGVLPAAR